MMFDPTPGGPTVRASRPSPTPSSFPSPFAQPPFAQGAAIVAPGAPPTALPVAPRAGRSAPVWLLGLLVLLLIGLVAYFLGTMGAGASIVGMLLALVPLIGVLWAVRIVDRWEPEPRSLVVLAVAWGAIAAIALALLVDLAISVLLGADGVARETMRAVVQAPVVEELAKGLGVLLIFVSARRAFDGPIDGVVYGALVGAGFAFTENIQYFAISYLEGGVADVSMTFFLRGIVSPFAHVMFTSLIGFALGLAARRGARGAQGMPAWLLGTLGAIALHALWNGSAMFGDFFALYATLQMPLFALFILGVIALRKEEARLTRARLGDYAAAGWFTSQEVEMLATPAGRRAALQWAGTLRGDRTELMKEFIHDAAGLASARQRAISGRDPHAAEDEHVLLARTSAARAALFTP